MPIMPPGVLEPVLCKMCNEEIEPYQNFERMIGWMVHKSCAEAFGEKLRQLGPDVAKGGDS